MMSLEVLKDTPPWDWPDDAGASLLAVLRNGGAAESDRLLAAELAGELVVINDDMARALVAIIGSGDSSDDLRSTAAIALGPAFEVAYTIGFDDPGEAALSEETFIQIGGTLRELCQDAQVPEKVRRSILEASVRAPEDWHTETILRAYSSGSAAWRRTAVFCMRWVPGFDEQILEALRSEDSAALYQAVCASGNWELAAAWTRVAALVASDQTDKQLRLVAIDAAATIRPREALDILGDLTDSDDEEIAAAAFEAVVTAEAQLEPDLDDDEEA